jgi:hypothetical protein
MEAMKPRIAFSVYLLGHTVLTGTALDRKEVERLIRILGEEVVTYTVNGITYKGANAEHYE